MKTSLKTGFAQFSLPAQKKGGSNIWGGGLQSHHRPPGPYSPFNETKKDKLFFKQLRGSYLFLTNPVRVTLTKNRNILGKNPLPVSLFTYYSLKIKFAPFLKSWPATIPCKTRTIEWATKLLINKKGKGRKRAREKD